MQKLKILNSKEAKRILGMIESQWGFKENLDYVFLENDKGRVYIANREIFDIDTEKLRVNSVGVYFADIKAGIRLSVEGSQIIGPKASKNVVELDEKEADRWMHGEDLDHPCESEDFVIIRHKSDFLGTGKSTRDGMILNFVPKERRVK